MYGIMIVDDEMLARIGIKVLIPWEENGFRLMGEYDNGRKALEAALAAKPDIIITDVKMPVLGGIDLIKELRSAGLDTKFIVMSSYDDFHLVKEAMRLGAQDYLLKLEIEADKLMDILRKTAKLLHREREEKERHLEFEKRFSSNISILRDTFLKNMILGHIPANEQTDKEIRLYQLPENGQALTCFLLNIENSEFYADFPDKDESLLESSIIHIMEDAALNIGSGAACRIRHGMFAAIVSVKSGKAEELEKLAGNMKKVLKNMLNVDVTIGMSRVFTHYGEAKDGFLEAVSSLEIGRGLQGAGEAGQQPTLSLPLEKELKQLEEQLKAYRMEAIESSFDEMIKRIEETEPQPKHILHAVGHVLIYILSGFIANHLQKNEELWARFGHPYEQLIKLKTNKELTEWMKSLQQKMNSLLIEARDDKLMILKAKQYIGEHFSENISLSSVAGHLGLSPGYFSRLFSREVSQTFIEYVTHLRMEYAKELLHSSNYKTYEISEMAGYDNPHYFFRLFKKMTGLTPGEYKEYLPKREREQAETN